MAFPQVTYNRPGAKFGLSEALNDPKIGYGICDDFLGKCNAGWVLTQATTGTFAAVEGAGGWYALDSASGTADQGAQIQLGDGTTAFGCFTPVAGTDHYFEAYLKVTDLISDCQFFAGLAAADTTVFNAGENSTANHIGFEMNATSIAAAAGYLYFVNEKAGTRTTNSSVKLLVEDTFVLLAFHVKGTDEIVAYVDGVEVARVTTNIPIVAMTPTFVCQSEGSSDPIVTIDWMQCVADAPSR